MKQLTINSFCDLALHFLIILSDHHSFSNLYLSQQFYVEPVNDAPRLYFSTPPNNVTQLNYAEDDPPLPLTDDLVLQDIDTKIALVAVELSGLLNKEQDIFSFNETLANEYEVDITQAAGGVTGTITLNGSASAEQYEQVRLQYLITCTPS